MAMTRKRYRVILLFELMVVLLVLASWWQSVWRPIHAEVGRLTPIRGRVDFNSVLQSSDGALQVGWGTGFYYPPGCGWTCDWWYSGGATEGGFDAESCALDRFGLHLFHRAYPLDSGEISYWSVVGVRYWALLLASGTCLLYSRIRLAAFSERPPEACPKCGYDLRASPERCPECWTLRSGAVRI
jgi:hypothetical protein